MQLRRRLADHGDRQTLKEAIEVLQASGEMKALLQKWNLPETATDISHDVN